MSHAFPLFATPAVPVGAIRRSLSGMSVREVIEMELDEAYLEMQEEAELEAIRASYANKAGRGARFVHAATY